MTTSSQRPDQRRDERTTIIVQPAKKNELGTSSFVLGLLGTSFGLVPFMAFIALPASLVGLGLGLGNIGRLNGHAATNKVMTWIGIGLSVLGVVLSIIGIAIVNNAVSNL